jgi:hypothetical protein
MCDALRSGVIHGSIMLLMFMCYHQRGHSPLLGEVNVVVVVVKERMSRDAATYRPTVNRYPASLIIIAQRRCKLATAFINVHRALNCAHSFKASAKAVLMTALI